MQSHIVHISRCCWCLNRLIWLLKSRLMANLSLSVFFLTLDRAWLCTSMCVCVCACVCVWVCVLALIASCVIRLQLHGNHINYVIFAYGSVLWPNPSTKVAKNAMHIFCRRARPLNDHELHKKPQIPKSKRVVLQSIAVVVGCECKAYQCKRSRCNCYPLPVSALQQEARKKQQLKINANIYCNPLGARNIMKRKCYCGSYSYNPGEDSGRRRRRRRWRWRPQMHNATSAAEAIRRLPAAVPPASLTPFPPLPLCSTACRIRKINKNMQMFLWPTF